MFCFNYPHGIYPVSNCAYLILLIPLFAILAGNLPQIVFAIFVVKLIIYIFDTNKSKEVAEDEPSFGNKVEKSIHCAADDIKNICCDAREKIVSFITGLKFSLDQTICKSDLKELSDSFIIEMDLPGVKKEEIKVETDGGKVCVSGKREIPTFESEPTSLLSERSFGEYKKIITMPTSADMNSVIAKYENGVLSIMIQKKGEYTKEKKSVNIE